MKSIISSILILFSIFTHGQIKIHAHNDYAKPEPLFNAMRNKAFSIEADVFLINEKLFVAHTMNEIDSQKTLQCLYIDPIIKLFAQNKEKHDGYAFSLVIDIKNNGNVTLQKLTSLFQPLGKYFDRSQNPNAVQIIISGDRGPIDQWKTYPAFIYFDGRPQEKYDSATLRKVAMVSDNYNKYAVAIPPDMDRIKSITQQVHQWNKPMRFWAAPDNEKAWSLLKDAGVDIINTDKIADCRKWIDSL